MNPMIRFFLPVLFFSFSASAQYSWTLQQCIDTAIAHNIPVKQSELDVEKAQVNLNQARMNVLPDLNAGINHNINSGRSIDPFTNAYVTQNVNAANYTIGSGITIFRGFAIQNTIRSNTYAYDASRMEWQQAKDNLVLNVILAYLQVLNDEDRVQVAIHQAEVSQKALDRLDVMNKQGAIRPSDFSDLKGQLMNDQLSILNEKASLETAKLSLSQLMNKPYDSTLKLERINIGEFLTEYPSTATEVYQNSLSQFSLIKAVELRRKSMQYLVKATKGLMFPQLSLNAGLNTNYSSVAQNNGNKISYSSQLKNNRFSSVGLGLTIPIFNASYARNQVRLTEIESKSADLIEENTKLQLHQEIDQAWLNMSQALDRYHILLEQMKAYEESFKAAEIRFNAGVGTSIDYLTAKDRFDRANISLVNARYEFVLRKKILDYYNGKP